MPATTVSSVSLRSSSFPGASPDLLRHASVAMFAAAGVVALMGLASAVSHESLANCATIGAAQLALLTTWAGTAARSAGRIS